MKNQDFYIYYNYNEVWDNNVALHFTSDGEMFDHSDTAPTVKDLEKAVQGFKKTYELVMGVPYDL